MPEFYDHDRTVTIYYYDDNGLYVEQKEKLIRRGVSLPPNSTEIAPTSFTEGMVAVFDGSEWSEVEDNRGIIVYDSNGGSIVIEDLGPIPTGYTTDPPPPTPEQLIARKQAIVYQYTDAPARALNFFSIDTAVTYADDPDPILSAQGTALKNFRSQCWVIARTALDQYESTGIMPSDQDILDMLPEFIAP